MGLMSTSVPSDVDGQAENVQFVQFEFTKDMEKLGLQLSPARTQEGAMDDTDSWNVGAQVARILEDEVQPALLLKGLEPGFEIVQVDGFDVRYTLFKNIVFLLKERPIVVKWEKRKRPRTEKEGEKANPRKKVKITGPGPVPASRLAVLKEVGDPAPALETFRGNRWIPKLRNDTLRQENSGCTINMRKSIWIGRGKDQQTLDGANIEICCGEGRELDPGQAFIPLVGAATAISWCPQSYSRSDEATQHLLIGKAGQYGPSVEVWKICVQADLAKDSLCPYKFTFVKSMGEYRLQNFEDIDDAIVSISWAHCVSERSSSTSVLGAAAFLFATGRVVITLVPYPEAGRTIGCIDTITNAETLALKTRATCIAWSQTRPSSVLIGGETGEIQLWNVNAEANCSEKNSAQVAHTFINVLHRKHLLEGHSGASAVCWAPHNSSIFAASYDNGMICIWDSADPVAPLRSFSSRVPTGTKQDSAYYVFARNDKLFWPMKNCICYTIEHGACFSFDPIHPSSARKHGLHCNVINAVSIFEERRLAVDTRRGIWHGSDPSCATSPLALIGTSCGALLSIAAKTAHCYKTQRNRQACWMTAPPKSARACVLAQFTITEEAGCGEKLWIIHHRSRMIEKHRHTIIERVALNQNRVCLAVATPPGTVEEQSIVQEKSASKKSVADSGKGSDSCEPDLVPAPSKCVEFHPILCAASLRGGWILVNILPHGKWK